MGDVWKPSIRERLVAKQEFNNSLDCMLVWKLQLVVNGCREMVNVMGITFDLPLIGHLFTTHI